MDFLKSFILNEPQTITLVPPIRENVKGDLAPDGNRQVEVQVLRAALFAKLIDECSADLVLLIMHVSIVTAARIAELLCRTLGMHHALVCCLKVSLKGRIHTSLIGTYVAFLPIGLTFTIPLRNSTNVPLRRASMTRTRSQRSCHEPLDWDVDLRQVAKYEVDEFFVLFLPHEVDERLCCQRFPESKGGQAVLCERKVKVF